MTLSILLKLMWRRTLSTYTVCVCVRLNIDFTVCDMVVYLYMYNVLINVLIFCLTTVSKDKKDAF